MKQQQYENRIATVYTAKCCTALLFSSISLSLEVAQCHYESNSMHTKEEIDKRITNAISLQT